MTFLDALYLYMAISGLFIIYKFLDGYKAAYIKFEYTTWFHKIKCKNLDCSAIMIDKDIYHLFIVSKNIISKDIDITPVTTSWKVIDIKANYIIIEFNNLTKGYYKLEFK